MPDDATADDAAPDTANGAASTADGAASAAGGEVAALHLDDDEVELVTADLDAVLPTLDGGRRERFAELRAAAADGSVPAELEPALVSLLELTLQTARARTRYRAEGEQVLTKLYQRTSAGRGLAEHLGQVNGALRSLAGQTVHGINVRMRTVDHFTITIQTDGATITLAARPDSLDVESVAVGT